MSFHCPACHHPHSRSTESISAGTVLTCEQCATKFPAELGGGHGQATQQIKTDALKKHLDAMGDFGGGGGGEIPTQQINAAALNQTLSNMQSAKEIPQAESVEFESKKKRPKFLLPLIAFVLGSVFASVVWHLNADEVLVGGTAFVVDEQAMFAGPELHPAYTKVGTLVRGAEVLVLKRYAAYAMIEDAMGRVSYIDQSVLQKDRPRLAPTSAFADCQRSPIALDATACASRAQAQNDACLSGCDDEEQCVKGCGEQFLSCQEGCKAVLSVKPEVASTPAQPKNVAKTLAEPKVQAPPPTKKTSKKRRRKRRRKK